MDVFGRDFTANSPPKFPDGFETPVAGVLPSENFLEKLLKGATFRNLTLTHG